MFPSCKWELNCIFLLHLQDGWLHGDTDQNFAGRTRGLWNTFGWRHLERRSPRTAWVFLLAMAPSTFFFRTFPEHVFMRSVFFDYPFLFQLVCYWFLWTKIVLVRNIFCWWFRNPINQFEVGSSSYSWRVLGTHPRPVVGLGLGISSSICPNVSPRGARHWDFSVSQPKEMENTSMRHCGRGNDTHVSSRISVLESFQRWEVPEELDISWYNITLSIICLQATSVSILYTCI